MAKRDEINENVFISQEMLKKCKKEIAKFGFQPKEYEKFLQSVEAMNGNNVMEYKLEQLEKYRQKYIKQHEVGLSDTMIFDKKVKVYFSDERKDKKYTGYFCPRYFWDFILEEKYDDTPYKGIEE